MVITDSLTFTSFSTRLRVYSEQKVGLATNQRKCPLYEKSNNGRRLLRRKHFVTQIESGNYSAALALADTFHLDSDLVYQQQWRKNPVSTEAIQKYLVSPTTVRVVSAMLSVIYPTLCDLKERKCK